MFDVHICYSFISADNKCNATIKFLRIDKVQTNIKVKIIYFSQVQRCKLVLIIVVAISQTCKILIPAVAISQSKNSNRMFDNSFQANLEMSRI